MPRHDLRVAAAALAGGLPAVGAAWWFARGRGDADAYALAAAGTAAWLIGAAAVRARVERPLQTLANMLAALREGDFSMRGRDARPDEALGLAFTEANLLTATLREERLRALESAALLRRVLGEIDAALFAFDEGNRLRLVNRAGERLLGRPAERLLGEPAAALGLAALGADPGADGAPDPPVEGTPRVVDATFPGGSGRWEVRAGQFRQGGRPHRLLLVTDVSETLRAEERAAWQRLIRVLSHEINNSLAPIKTIAGSLRRRVRRAGAGALAAGGAPSAAAGAAGGAANGAGNGPANGAANAEAAGDARLGDDFDRGLGTIAERADALARFVGAYARLSRLPPPARRPMVVGPWVRRVAALEPRVPVTVLGGPEAGPGARLDADPDQLDQLLINLVRNAADAVLARTAPAHAGGPGDAGAPCRDGDPPGVRLAWGMAEPDAGGAARVRVTVDDDGPGLASTANLFVPFYSTKPDGSGIGLALARQIAEAHGGTVTLANRAPGPGEPADAPAGCRATVLLPAAAG